MKAKYLVRCLDFFALVDGETVFEIEGFQRFRMNA